MYNTLNIATFNIHKGFTHFNTHFSLQNQRELIRKLNADVVFLQEVQDTHAKHSQHIDVHSASRQLQYLADNVWSNFAYGKNAVYPTGHHGNGILSKFPITKVNNQDISAHRLEQRGMLHCQINIPQWESPLHAICVHLGLLATWRRQQLGAIADYIEQHVPIHAPLIIAGDFNDWTMRSGRVFAKRLHLLEVFEDHKSKPARSFPGWLPILRVDRIYARGFQINHTEVHSGPHFIKLSDHAILTAKLNKK
ncbi:MAG TPA: hypothetical protein DCO68_08385 [Methylophilaceae bacterium]|nr:hypothetical protein [Methylophilaceae bacterium]